GDDIVDEIKAQGPGIAEIGHLDRRRPIRQDAGPRALRVPLEVDRNVDAELLQELRNRAVARRGHIVKAVERGGEPGAHRAAVIAAERDANHLEARAVMALEQAGRELRSGMVAKIAREIGHANPALVRREPDLRQWLALADFGLRKARGGLRQRGIVDWE